MIITTTNMRRGSRARQRYATNGGFPATKRLIKSEDISGDTGAVAVEELGRVDVGNPAVELSEIGGECTGAEASARRLGVLKDWRCP